MLATSQVWLDIHYYFNRKYLYAWNKDVQPSKHVNLGKNLKVILKAIMMSTSGRNRRT